MKFGPRHMSQRDFNFLTLVRLSSESDRWASLSDDIVIHFTSEAGCTYDFIPQSIDRCIDVHFHLEAAPDREAIIFHWRMESRPKKKHHKP